MATTFLMVLCGLYPAAPLPPPTPEDSGTDPIITVVGSGAVSAMPDTAEVRLRLVTQGFSASSALRDNASAVESLRRRLGERGIPRKDVQTLTSGVVPQVTTIADPPAAPEVSGYFARSTVQVTVHRPGRLGDLLDDAAGEGAEVRDVTYSVENSAPLLAQARRRALADARRRAESYAREAGMELGPMLYVEDQSPDNTQPASDDEGSAVEQTFRASVAVAYSLHPKPGGRKLEGKERR
jgi:uncharacterized protein